MKKKRYFTQYITGMALFAFVCGAFAYEIDKNEQNTSLTDSRVSSQYIPVEKSNIGNSIGYAFIDRNSINIHPFNSFIRTYSRVINYGPALLLEKEGENVPYRSVVSHEYVNCDKKEYAKKTISTYEHYFGEGSLQSSDNELRRWIGTKAGSRERQNLVIICSLPIKK